LRRVRGLRIKQRKACADPGALASAAVRQERELDSILQSVVGLLGPVMILVMGGMVLLIVLAMLMPIFQLNELVR